MRLILALTVSCIAAPALAADAARPTVVELFESQGCSSCPPANAALASYAGRPDILALTFAVTYWDRLGWKDTFDRPEFTERQYAYASKLGGGAYTPEVVVNGRAAGVGADVAEVEALARRADRAASGPALSLEGDAVAIGQGAAPAGGAEVWLALYEPHPADVVIARGENAGRTLAHRNVGGGWFGSVTGPARPCGFPCRASGGLSRAVIVQRRGLGAVIAAAKG